MSQSPNVQIIPAKITPPQVANNEVYISQTNESVGLHITHYKPTGGQVWSVDNPLSPSAQIEYTLACDQNAVISTTNSYWAYNLQLPFQIYAADTNAANYGKFYVQNAIWWFQPCNNVANLDNTANKVNGVGTGVIPTYGTPIPICLFPMSATAPIYRSRINYGGSTFLDEMVFRESVNIQALLPETYQMMMKQTWFDFNTDKLLSFECMPYTYVTDAIDANNRVTSKVYCSPAQFIAALGGGAGTGPYLSDGVQILPDKKTIIYTIQPWFFVPLNVINQILDVGNSFFISLLSGQQCILRIETNPYSYAQMFGNSDMFVNRNGQGPKCGIIDMDLVLVTKTSEVAVTDEAAKDNIIKFFPKYQWTNASINLPAAVSQQSYQITTVHNSVRDVILQLRLPDEGGITYAQGTEYWMNDSTYVKQRCTLFNVSQILSIENLKLNSANPFLADYDGSVAQFGIKYTNATPIITSNDDFMYFYKINFDRGNNSLRIYSDWFQIIDQMKMELLRSNNYLGQYKDVPPRSWNNLQEMMTKYAFFICNFENFSMDVPGAHTFVGMDGYASKYNGMITCNFTLGRFRQSNNNMSFSNTYPTSGASTQSYIYNNVYMMDCYQYYDEALKISPKNTGNKMSQSEEIV